ncbi:nucleolar protein 14 isoform X1 [Protopterus annectens]|uniref:nucleolar protein 14 isoform X1 n=1 Tax=Protopterus annectens TaxID=7888 RepID=UPI001CFB2B55|nr:nucleolar protein 14 isoform X1 [Protopterus annectens]
MGKTQKKKNLSDKVRKTKTSTEVKNNPFEVKINKQKFNILGRKTKHDRGLPGVSRSKAIKKRRETLLQEYKQKDKSRAFIDKRFAEYDTRLAPEEKMMKRFALERQRTYEKKDIYNLNEDEELTHYGQSLADIEKLIDNPDSESDTEDKGILSAEFTAGAHFGGGGGLLRKKVSSEEQAHEEDEEKKPKSRKELIEDLIVKSKKEKYERQTQREKATELTLKLDNDWKEIQALLAHKTPKSERNNKEEAKSKQEDYDIIVRELGFEMKAKPSDRLKTEQELAKEERERLQKLEADRLRRMRGEDPENETCKKPDHISADDLNDGFILDKSDKQTLMYKDGKFMIEGEQCEDEELEAEDEESENQEEDSNEEGDADSSDADEDIGGGGDSDDAENSEASDGSESEDNHSDLNSDSGNEGKEAVAKEKSEQKVKVKEQVLSEEEKKAMTEAAKSELPFTFPAPETLNDLKSLLVDYSAEKQCVIIERILKCNHPSLAAGNKVKLEKLFSFLFEYVGELATGQPPGFRCIDMMVPHLYNLCQMFPDSASSHIQSVLKNSIHKIDQMVETKGRGTLPGLETCSVGTLQDVATGLIICCLFLEYVSLSQRFVPEVINFLLGVLHLAVPNTENLGYTLVPPFRCSGRASELLLIKDKAALDSWEMKPVSLSAVIRVEEEDELGQNHFGLSCVALSLDLIKRCIVLYGSLPAFHEIMQPIRTLISQHLPMDQFPQQLQKLSQDVLKEIESKPRLYNGLVFEKKKPVPLKLYTPKIKEVLDFGRKRGGSRQERERMRLVHKHKREFKAAIREIRRDNQFLARHRLAETLNKDSERKRKVKDLFNSLSAQEGEWKSLKKKKLKG